MGLRRYSRTHPKAYFAIIFITSSITLQILCVTKFSLAAMEAWLTATNIVAFLLWSYDKWRAGKKGLRVPELVLHFMAACGASPASLVSMSVLRHKTSKRRFGVLYTVMLLLQGALFLRFGS